MNRKIAGAALVLLSAFMLLGFARSDAGLSSPTALFALLITVALPAIGGIALLRGSLGTNSRARMNQLRQQTIEAEILRLAMQHKGLLTAVEVASALALSEGESKSCLDELVRRQVAELEISDEGLLVYTFHEARYVEGKNRVKGVLDD